VLAVKGPGGLGPPGLNQAAAGYVIGYEITRFPRRQAMRIRVLAPAGLAAAALVVAACGGSSGSGTAASSAPMHQAAGSMTMVKAAKVMGATVLTNSKGFTLYWFAPDTSTISKCNGSCASIWPPVKGPITAGPGVMGKVGTIKRSDGSIQATYNGHPLYTYTADTGPHQDHGNGINASGGVWHEVTVSGAAAPAPSSPSSSSSSGGGGYGY
jgi:predicted lipoprotein with Yx(FWY)xxD motif